MQCSLMIGNMSCQIVAWQVGQINLLISQSRD
jgi:hypothetical protein